MTQPARGALPVVPVRHPGRWVGAAVVLVLAAMFIHWLVATPDLRWDVVGHYLFDAVIVSGVRKTIVLTIIAMVIGIVLGVVLAIMRLSPNPVLSGASW